MRTVPFLGSQSAGLNMSREPKHSFMGVKIFLSKYAILLVLVFAALIRLIGVDYGLPYLYFPDEHHFTYPAFRILTEGDLNPHWFGHPGSFVTYILAILWIVVIGIHMLLGALSGNPTTFSDIQQQIAGIPHSDPTMFYLSGRILMIVFSLITIYALYILGKKHLNRTIGLLSAFLLAISPLFIDFSRRIRTDVSSAMLITLSLLFLMNFFDDNPRTKWLVLSSLFAGFSVASKYTSVIVVCPILIYCVICDRKANKSLPFRRYVVYFFRQKTNLSRAMLWIFIGFFIFAPFVILDFPSAFRDISKELNMDYFFAIGQPGLDNYNWYIKEVLNPQLSQPFYIYIVLLGLLFVLTKKNREPKLWLLFLFPVLYFVLTGLGGLRWSRWMVPILPFTSLLFSIGICAFYKGITQSVTGKAKAVWIITLTVFLGALSYPTIVYDFEQANLLTRSDRRTIAKEWIEENLPEGSTIAYEADGPLLHIRPKRRFELIDMSWQRITSRPFRFYERKGVEYLLINRFSKSNILRRAGKYPLKASRYEEIEKRAQLIRVFNEKGHPGGVYELYKLKKKGDCHLFWKPNLKLIHLDLYFI